MAEVGDTQPISNANEHAQVLRDYYTREYKGKESTDTPSNSNAMLVRQVKIFLLSRTETEGQSPSSLIIADIGSGTQVFDKLLKNALGGRGPRYQTVTFDIAKIAMQKLLLRNDPNVTHIQADTRHLPLKAESVDVAVSNLALHFAGDQGWNELSRVLKPDGVGFLNLDVPSVSPDDVDKQLAKTGKESTRNILHHKKYLHDNGLLFQTETDMKERLAQYGLTVDHAEKITQENYSWWNIQVRKMQPAPSPTTPPSL